MEAGGQVAEALTDLLEEGGGSMDQLGKSESGHLAIPCRFGLIVDLYIGWYTREITDSYCIAAKVPLHSGIHNPVTQPMRFPAAGVKSGRDSVF
jgi:hypothetical protein